MKVLLCTPFNIGPQYVKGGIVVWAQNIVEYYNTLSTDIQLQLVPYDRTVGNNEEKVMLSRAWSGFIEYYKPIKETRNILGKEDVDIVHLCTSASISLVKDLVVLRMAKHKEVKSVIHFHFGRIPELAQRKNWEWRLVCKVVSLADSVITMDIKSFKVLIEHGFKNVHYLPNPLSLGIIRQIKDNSDNTTREKGKLSFVGHVIPTKGVYELVKACKGLLGIRLHIFGKATPEVQEQMKVISGNSDWLVFEGEVEHRRVIQELLTSSIFVLPTYTEGFPNVILESMACGCAIVTTPVGAIPEMLAIDSSEPCGLCTDPKDIAALRNSIKSFLDNPKLAQEYGSRAIKRVNDLFSVDKVWGQLVGIWQDTFSIAKGDNQE